MRAFWSLLAGAVFVAGMGGCNEKKTPAPAAAPTTTQPVATAAPRVEFTIGRGGEEWGKIVLQLDAEGTPITTRNFLRYVEEGYYDGTIFHRIIPTFMIQGGGFTALNKEKTAGQHDPILNEARSGGSNKAYTIAMARTGDPNSATSEFFINVVDNARKLDPNEQNFGYAVFGKVVSGKEVVNRIRDVEVKLNATGDEKSEPIDPPVLLKARVVK